MTAHPALSPRVPDPALGGILKLAVMAVGGQGGGVLATYHDELMQVLLRDQQWRQALQ